jgi:hypothetical protein
MNHSLVSSVLLASGVVTLREELLAVIQPIVEKVVNTTVQFALNTPSPAATLAFEQDLHQQSRELNRQAVQWAFNRAEADGPESLPHDMRYENDGYRRLNEATPNRHVATLFGTITLWRHGYRSWHRDDGLPTVFPREQLLGLVEGATPALLERMGRYLADAGATQESVLQRLREEHGVHWGVKRLRDAADALTGMLDEFRNEHQMQRLLELLRKAEASQGRHRPVLSVGRDGITLWTQPYGFFEVATAATLAVFDRHGRRLGTVYLAYAPELGQGTMTDQLTRLLRGVLAAYEGPPPRLCYVTDAGDHETAYYRKVLRPMRHPRTGRRMEWYWIVDFCHAAQRLTTMAEAIFGEGREAATWAAKMRRVLKQPNGPARVLWSAAKLRANRGLRFGRKKAFERAYNYLRTRTKYLRYAEYRRLGLPLGSGITEAACKTIYTSRLKLSGMRWKREGAQTILTLRVILLSGTWTATYEAARLSKSVSLPQPYVSPRNDSSNIAA